jgi:hypothetical protein
LRKSASSLTLPHLHRDLVDLFAQLRLRARRRVFRELVTLGFAADRATLNVAEMIWRCCSESAPGPAFCWPPPPPPPCCWSAFDCAWRKLWLKGRILMK